MLRITSNLLEQTLTFIKLYTSFGTKIFILLKSNMHHFPYILVS